MALLSGYYCVAESGFNPNPQATTFAGLTTCAASTGECPGFRLTSASLKVISMVDITSQELTFSITATSSGPMARVDVYIDNVSVGAVQGPFESGVPKQVGLGVPTTITVSVNQSYRVLVGSVYTDSAGKTAAEYWQAFDVVAAGG